MNKQLVVGSIGIFIVALLHFIMPSLAPQAYDYFGASDFTPLAESGSIVPAVVTYGIAIIFCAFGVVGLSTAGVFRTFAFSRVICWIIAIVFMLRGLGMFIQVIFLVVGMTTRIQDPFFSAVALAIGILLTMGLRSSSSSLTYRKPPAP